MAKTQRKPRGWGKFADLARKLVKVPKSEIEESKFMYASSKSVPYFTYHSKVVNLFTVAHEDSESAARCLGAMIEKVLVMYSDEYGRK